jgi:hypothetical protein
MYCSVGADTCGRANPQPRTHRSRPRTRLHAHPLRSPSRSADGAVVVAQHDGRANGVGECRELLVAEHVTADRRGASLIGLFPWKFPEGGISQDMQIPKRISRNLCQGQRLCLRHASMCMWCHIPSDTRSHSRSVLDGRWERALGPRPECLISSGQLRHRTVLSLVCARPPARDPHLRITD